MLFLQNLIPKQTAGWCEPRWFAHKSLLSMYFFSGKASDKLINYKSSTSLSKEVTAGQEESTRI